MELAWWSLGAVMAVLWCCHGAVIELSWGHRGKPCGQPFGCHKAPLGLSWRRAFVWAKPLQANAQTTRPDNTTEIPASPANGRLNSVSSMQAFFRLPTIRFYYQKRAFVTKQNSFATIKHVKYKSIPFFVFRNTLKHYSKYSIQHVIR